MVRVLIINQPPLTRDIAIPREIDCANPQKDFFIQPIGLSYIAGMIRKKISIDIIDANVLRRDYKWVAKKIREEKPELVLGGFTAPTSEHDMRLAKVIKENSRAKFGIWGGVAGIVKADLFAKYPELDFIIENEPEFVMNEVVGNLKRGKDLFKGVKGLSYRTGKKWRFNGLRELKSNLDELEFPAYDMLPLERYYTPYNRRLPMVWIRTSRGCPFNCIFCVVGGQVDCRTGYGKRWRAYSSERALAEIEWLVKEQGIKEICFFDPEFTIDKQRVIDICKGIVKRRINFIWNCQARVDQVNKEALKWMKRAGCYGISYGLETANEKIMKNINKQVSKEQAEQAIKTTTEVGIQCGVFFMLGLPGETIKTARETIEFAKYLSKKYGARPQCTVATPYPGTRFYEQALKNNWLKGKSLDLLEQTTPSVSYPHLTAEQLDELHNAFYKEVVLDPIRLLKRVLRIRHRNELRNMFLAIKHFAKNYFSNMRYIR